MPITPQQFWNIRDRDKWVYAIGKIVYIDDAGNGRRTGFARRYDIQTERFDIVSDPDYEYED